MCCVLLCRAVLCSVASWDAGCVARRCDADRLAPRLHAKPNRSLECGDCVGVCDCGLCLPTLGEHGIALVIASGGTRVGGRVRVFQCERPAFTRPPDLSCWRLFVFRR